MTNDMIALEQAKTGLTDKEINELVSTFHTVRKDPIIALILGLTFGVFGVDRFYIGDTGLGVGKLLTLGGFFIWAFVDLFLIMNATRDKNVVAISGLRQSILSRRQASPPQPPRNGPPPPPPPRV